MAEVQYPPPLGAAPASAAGSSSGSSSGSSDDGGCGVSPQQVLLAAGAVAVVAGGWASRPLTGWVLPTVLAVAAAAASLRCGRRGLRSSEETLAVAAVVLALISDRSSTSGVVLAALALVFWWLGRVGRTALTWPIAAWGTAQLAVLLALRGAEPAQLPWVTAVLGTAVAGLLGTLRARRAVAAVLLATAVPWWMTGVAGGNRLVWTTTATGTAAAAGLLLVAAAAALMAPRLRPELRPWLGPRPLVPVLAGSVTGAAVAGVLHATGPAGVPAAGYLGLVTASLVAEFAAPRLPSVVRPAGLALAGTATALAVVQLLTDGRWTALALLLLTAAAPALLLAARQPVDRPGALPVTVGCLAGAALLAEADGTLGPGWAGPLLMGLAVAALAAATLERHHRAEVPLAVSGVVVGLVAVAHLGRTGSLLGLAGALAVLGAALFGYADRTERAPARAGGCGALVVAAWLVATDAGVRVPEAYSLPLAAVLLLYAGRRLATAPSGSSWGPALAAGYGPPVFLSLLDPELLRVLLVVGAATLTTVAAARWGVRAPFLVGAGSLVAVAAGRLVAVLATPTLVAFTLAGGLLLAVGASYESRRRRAREAIAFVADMR